jgi:hypothetical protein
LLSSVRRDPTPDNPLTQAVSYDDAKAGAAIAVQSFSVLQNFIPHLLVLATVGCFYRATFSPRH